MDNKDIERLREQLRPQPRPPVVTAPPTRDSLWLLLLVPVLLLLLIGGCAGLLWLGEPAEPDLASPRTPTTTRTIFHDIFGD